MGIEDSSLLALLSSAAVGALVSSVITTIDRWRERKSRREELLLAKSAEMTTAHIDLIMKSGGGKMEPPLLMLEDYYRSLKHLVQHDTLDPKDKQRIETELKKQGMKS
jgi:hypothetical protein